MTDLWLAPAVEHHLAVAVRFVDVFTGSRVVEPMEVRVAGHPRWRPTFSAGDATYRFFTTNEPVPVLGMVDLEVQPLGDPATYRAEEPIQIAIPRPGPPPSPLTFDHYLSEHSLWPTRIFRPSAGDTAIRARLLDPGGPVAGARVAIAPAPMPAGTPVAYTDAEGEFVYRLPDLGAQTVGDTVTTTASVTIAVRDSTDTVRAVATPALPVIIPTARTTPLTITLT